MDRIERSIELPVSPEDAWPAVTQPDGLSAWFGARVAMEKLENGARIEFVWPDGSARAAVLEEVVPARRLAFRWLPFEKTSDGPRARPATRVEIELIETDGGCILKVLESAPLEASIR